MPASGVGERSVGSAPASSSVSAAPGGFGTMRAGLSSATRTRCVPGRRVPAALRPLPSAPATTQSSSMSLRGTYPRASIQNAAARGTCETPSTTEPTLSMRRFWWTAGSRGHRLRPATVRRTLPGMALVRGGVVSGEGGGHMAGGVGRACCAAFVDVRAAPARTFMLSGSLLRNTKIFIRASRLGPHSRVAWHQASAATYTPAPSIARATSADCEVGHVWHMRASLLVLAYFQFRPSFTFLAVGGFALHPQTYQNGLVLTAEFGLQRLQRRLQFVRSEVAPLHGDAHAGRQDRVSAFLRPLGGKLRFRAHCCAPPPPLARGRGLRRLPQVAGLAA